MPLPAARVAPPTYSASNASNAPHVTRLIDALEVAAKALTDAPKEAATVPQPISLNIVANIPPSQIEVKAADTPAPIIQFNPTITPAPVSVVSENHIAMPEPLVNFSPTITPAPVENNITVPPPPVIVQPVITPKRSNIAVKYGKDGKIEELFKRETD
jgi:hypothetical protein